MGDNVSSPTGKRRLSKVLEATDRLRSRGRLPEALAALESAWLPGRESVHFSTALLLAELLIHQHQVDKALHYSRTAVGLNPESADALHLEALALHAAGDPEKAEARCHRCLALAPEHSGGKDLLFMLNQQTVRPATETKFRKLRSGRSSLSVRLQSPSDREKNPDMRKMWGDYWVKHELKKAFADMGIQTAGDAPDFVVHFFGAPPRKPLPDNTVNIAWIYSHPDLVTPGNLRAFDRIFVASESFADKLRTMGYLNVETMFACTAKTVANVPLRHDMIFLGNARGSRTDGRKIVADMRATGLDFKVWGNRWENILPEKFIGGRYWPYECLSELYAAAAITLNDHHPDMAREGFVSNKVFDILASGGFVISGKNTGLRRLFGDAVPEYETRDDLKHLAELFLNHPEKRKVLQQKGRELAAGHTYAACAARMIAL